MPVVEVIAGQLTRPSAWPSVRFMAVQVARRRWHLLLMGALVHASAARACAASGITRRHVHGDAWHASARPTRRRGRAKGGKDFVLQYQRTESGSAVSLADCLSPRVFAMASDRDHVVPDRHASVSEAVSRAGQGGRVLLRRGRHHIRRGCRVRERRNAASVDGQDDAPRELHLEGQRLLTPDGVSPVLDDMDAWGETRPAGCDNPGAAKGVHCSLARMLCSQPSLEGPRGVVLDAATRGSIVAVTTRLHETICIHATLCIDGGVRHCLSSTDVLCKSVGLYSFFPLTLLLKHEYRHARSQMLGHKCACTTLIYVFTRTRPA